MVINSVTAVVIAISILSGLTTTVKQGVYDMSNRTGASYFVLDYQGHGNWSMSDPLATSKEVLAYIAEHYLTQYEVVRKVYMEVNIT